MTISELITQQILNSCTAIHSNLLKRSSQEAEIYDAIITGEGVVSLIRKLVQLKDIRAVDPKKVREVLQGKEETEVVRRYRNGVMEERVIDKRLNDKRQRQVQEARRKDRVCDILADANVEKRTAVGAVECDSTAQHLVRVKCEMRGKKVMTC